MAGVNSPSPITIHVPRRTKISNAVCKDLCFSSNNLTHELFFFSGGCSSLYVESASSETWRLGRRLTLACLHIREQRANVPPAKLCTMKYQFYDPMIWIFVRLFQHSPSPLSSARRTIKTYLNKGTRVKVQKTNERTPKISSFVSE